jgi:hypothetical protein
MDSVPCLESSDGSHMAGPVYRKMAITQSSGITWGIRFAYRPYRARSLMRDFDAPVGHHNSRGYTLDHTDQCPD